MIAPMCTPALTSMVAAVSSACSLAIPQFRTYMSMSVCHCQSGAKHCICHKSFGQLEGLQCVALVMLFSNTSLSSPAGNAADAAAGSCCTLLHLAAAMSGGCRGRLPSALSAFSISLGNCSSCKFEMCFALLAFACATQITHAVVLALHACCKISYNIRSLFISHLLPLSPISYLILPFSPHPTSSLLRSAA
jgi:hypothetical protein